MSFGDIAAEAMSGTMEGDDLDARIDEALACPCVADLREGPCGKTFSSAFRCFIKSEHPDKGMDCIPQFKSFQECLHRHPEFTESIVESASQGEEGVDGPKAGAAATAPAAK